MTAEQEKRLIQEGRVVCGQLETVSGRILGRGAVGGGVVGCFRCGFRGRSCGIRVRLFGGGIGVIGRLTCVSIIGLVRAQVVHHSRVCC